MSGISFIAIVGMILILLFVMMQLGPLISVWFPSWRKRASKQHERL